MFQLLRLLLLIVLVAWVTQQVRKPSGFLVSRQARGTRDESEPRDDDRVGAETVDGAEERSDPGCRRRRADIGALAALAPEGKVFGPDYSAASVAVARELNAHAIGA